MPEATIDELILWVFGQARTDDPHAIAVCAILENYRALQWHDTSEEPEAGAIVLCHPGALEGVVVGHLNQGIWCTQSGHVLEDVPAFWLPLSALPPAPEVTATEQETK